MTQSRFLLIMGMIAFAMIFSWILIDVIIGYDSFGELPIGMILIVADLTAFAFIGAVLKRKIEK